MQKSTPFNTEAVLLERFGLASFRPGQREIIEVLLHDESALAVFPTGGGKSLCYQLPALLLEGVTVVISPLIALMKDQIDFLRKRGIAAARLDSTLSAQEDAEVSRQLREGTLSLLYVAPERFNNERFLNQLRQIRIALFAIDEAHCISQWGHNFRPDYIKLADTIQMLGIKRVLALTATATPSVIKDICESLRILPEGVVVTGFYRPNLFLHASPTAAEHRDEYLIKLLKSRPAGVGIVYVTLQKTAESVAQRLISEGFPAHAYHAGMEDEARNSVQEWWKNSNNATVVATIAFGMGIDKADVRYVYHYNLPKSLESYSQEIGRAGRDGQSSIVQVLGSQEDQAILENFTYGDTPTRAALHSLVKEIYQSEDPIDVQLGDLAARHDIRPLVLRTALTYLELLGVLRQGTPFYTGYKIKTVETPQMLAARFQEERAQFIADIFSKAKKGRIWYTIEDISLIAEQLGQDRQRIVKALSYLCEQGWIELQPMGARQRYHLLSNRPIALEPLVTELEQRFMQREKQEIARVQSVIDLLTDHRCLTHRLTAYFGEERSTACGHCSVCTKGSAAQLPTIRTSSLMADTMDWQAFKTLCTQWPTALSHPRQQARFLCGLTSPALTHAKLTKHLLFGKMESQRFLAILEELYSLNSTEKCTLNGVQLPKIVS